MRLLSLFVFILLSEQCLSQWICNKVEVPLQGHSLLINGGLSNLVSSFKDESKMDTWKTEWQWKTIQYRDNNFLHEWKSWSGIGCGYASDSLVFFTQQNARAGNQYTKIFYVYKNVVATLMGELSGNDSDPFFDEVDNWLYFSSDRQGGMGGWDLYRMKWSNGHWSEVQNLGPGVNSTEDERYPILNPSGLTFSAKTEKGDWDIFISPNQESFSARWQMEEPINSAADDIQWFQWSEDYGWLISNRNQPSLSDNVLFELNRKVQSDSFCFVFQEPFIWKKNQVYSKQFDENKGCVDLALGVMNHWQFFSIDHSPLAYTVFNIVDRNGDVVAELFTDDAGRVTWQFLGIDLGKVQWLSLKDDSNLLADNSGMIFSSVASNRPPIPHIIFEKNGSKLDAGYHEALLSLSMYLVLHPIEKVKLIGSCDIAGDMVLNERLAWERAFSVQAFLMAHGVLLKQIDVEIDMPQSKAIKATDRKVEIAFQ